jgi:hypothetical protein
LANRSCEGSAGAGLAVDRVLLAPLESGLDGKPPGTRLGKRACESAPDRGA